MGLGRRGRRAAFGCTVALASFFAFAACSSSGSAPAVNDARGDGALTALEASSPDADAYTPIVGADASTPDAFVGNDGAPPLHRVSGHVDFGGPVSGAAVTLLAPNPWPTVTDSNGDFAIYAPLGSNAIMRVEAPDLLPMIRGVVVMDMNRIRQFYLAGDPDRQAVQAVGQALDPAMGVVEVDFRDSATGGFGVTLHAAPGGGVVTPGFVIATDADGDPQLSPTTITGGDGSTLFLGNVPPGTVSFVPESTDAGVTCTPCDAPELPVKAGEVTWFDFECGSATDCP